MTGLDLLFALAIYWMGIAIVTYYRPTARDLRFENAQLRRELEDAEYDQPIFEWTLDPSLSIERQRRLKEAIDEYESSG